MLKLPFQKYYYTPIKNVPIRFANNLSLKYNRIKPLVTWDFFINVYNILFYSKSLTYSVVNCFVVDYNLVRCLHWHEWIFYYFLKINLI